MFVFHTHPVYPHSSFPVILQFLLDSTCIILNPRMNISVITLCLTKTSSKCGSREGPPWKKGFAQISDSFTTEVDFFKTSFSFWKVGNWFSCLLKHHCKAGSWRAKPVTGFKRPGTRRDPRAREARRSARRSLLLRVQKQPGDRDSRSADRAGSHLKLH